jgi:uncharacterized protein YdhG (YjbR/CyaY superfamily)
MSKTKPAQRRAATKRAAAKKAVAKKSAFKRTAAMTVDQYIAAAPEPARGALKEIREAIRSVVPAESVEIISYQIPAFRHKKVLVWYAAFSEHCSLFPTAAVIGQFKDELQGFSTAKGTVHFSLAKPMPIALIKKMVQARLARTA